MEFRVGEKVFHCNHGLGEIVKFDEKVLDGRKTRCYVVQIRDLTIWVPVESTDRSSLRLLTPRSEFKNLFTILSSEGKQLSGDRNERRMQLHEKMKDGRMESICLVIRDLSLHRRTKRMNDSDVAILTRARNFLLNEWAFSFSVPLAQAERELSKLLKEQDPKVTLRV